MLSTGGNMAFPEGIRLNNAGMLEKSHDQWNGECRLQDNRRFIRFNTPQAGLRAMMKTLLTYEDIHGLNTITRIISRYAPPGENNTEYYNKDVSERTGLSPNMILDLQNPDILIQFAQAIVIHENGHAHSFMPYYWYEEVTYHEAAMAALEDE
jgi:hypothetical protein